MTASVLVLGIVAGLDNLQVCSSIGLLPLRQTRRHVLAAAFSLCEIGAPLLGLLLGRLALSLLEPLFSKAAPFMVFICGALVLWQAVRQK
jgi:putative Mn2+ efflux pump MntP